MNIKKVKLFSPPSKISLSIENTILILKKFLVAFPFVIDKNEVIYFIRSPKIRQKLKREKCMIIKQLAKSIQIHTDNNTRYDKYINKKIYHLTHDPFSEGIDWTSSVNKSSSK